MKVRIKLRATRTRGPVCEELSFSDDTALMLHIGNKHLRGLAVYISMTGAIRAGGRLGVAGSVTALDAEALSYYPRPLTLVKKAG